MTRRESREFITELIYLVNIHFCKIPIHFHTDFILDVLDIARFSTLNVSHLIKSLPLKDS